MLIRGFKWEREHSPQIKKKKKNTWTGRREKRRTNKDVSRMSLRLTSRRRELNVKESSPRDMGKYARGGAKGGQPPRLGAILGHLVSGRREGKFTEEVAVPRSVCT